MVGELPGFGTAWFLEEGIANILSLGLVSDQYREIIGFPSIKEFLQMIDSNRIQNCDVARRNIQIADNIYGVKTNIVKGKTIWRQPQHVREDILPVPPDILKHYQNITLGIDVYTVNEIKFFRTISQHIRFRTNWAINDAKKGTLMGCVEPSLGSMPSQRGFIVTQLVATATNHPGLQHPE
eukprot:jgi/Psemu1/30874/gm1.30874_g